MFVDGRSISQGSLIETDVCIIGAGAAGITLARELPSGFRVTLLESGGLSPDRETDTLKRGTVEGDLALSLEALRLRQFGGTTQHWQGRCRPLEANDLAERSWIPHSGWPFDRAHLDPYYEKAAELCELESTRFDVAGLEARVGAPALELDPEVVRSVDYELSPPTRFGTAHRARIEAASNIRVLLYSNALELVTDADANRVESVRVGCLDGNEFRVQGSWFVIAAGGIETPRLLLLSNRIREAGLGNDHDLVGRYFMDHPVLGAAVWIPSRKDLDLRFYAERPPSHGDGGARVASMGWLSLSPGVAEAEAIGAFDAAIVPLPGWRSPGEESLAEVIADVREGRWPDDLAAHLARVAEDFDLLVEDVTRCDDEPAPYQAFATSTEMAPDPENRVTLDWRRDALGQSRARLRVRLGELDRRTVLRGTRRLAQEFGRAGLGRVRLREQDWDMGEAASRAHHMGTARMHADPRRGVVDPDGRVHGVSNLYIASSAVFPTSGAGTPTLTIVALAVRLARHLVRSSVG